MDAVPGTRMLLEFPGLRERMTGTLLGLEAGVCLILKVPLTIGVRSLAREGNAVTVRLLHAGRVVGFRATVIDYVTKPYSLLFVTYPSSFETLDLRKDRRVDCFFPADADFHGRNYRGLLLDVSATGCKLLLDLDDPALAKQFRRDDNLSVRFRAFDRDRDYTVAGVIQNAALDGLRLTLGLRFDGASPDIAESIAAYVQDVAEALAT